MIARIVIVVITTVIIIVGLFAVILIVLPAVSSALVYSSKGSTATSRGQMSTPPVSRSSCSFYAAMRRQAHTTRRFRASPVTVVRGVSRGRHPAALSNCARTCSQRPRASADQRIHLAALYSTL